jgi:hypothetical protein
MASDPLQNVASSCWVRLQAGRVAAGRYKASRDNDLCAGPRGLPQQTARITADTAGSPHHPANARTDQLS